MASVKVEGLSQLLAKLQRLPKEVAGPIAARAVEDGGQIVLDAARRNAPVERGKLRGSIHMIIRRKRRNGGWDALVRTGTRDQLGIRSDDPSYYPDAIEFGTIQRFHKSGKSTGSIAKPPEHPFMRPAFDNNVKQCIDAISDTLGRRIEQAAKA